MGGFAYGSHPRLPLRQSEQSCFLRTQGLKEELERSSVKILWGIRACGKHTICVEDRESTDGHIIVACGIRIQLEVGWGRLAFVKGNRRSKRRSREKGEKRKGFRRSNHLDEERVGKVEKKTKSWTRENIHMATTFLIQELGLPPKGTLTWKL